MKLGLQIPIYTWPGGAAELGPKLAEIVRAAEYAGYDSIWVMDHYFQIFGDAEREMLEAYTTLGYIAGHTSRVRLGTLVTGVTYRHPGILAKQISTLDVLSGGRAYLGIEDRPLWVGGRIAVGTPITERPPHKSVRAAFPHTAPTSGV